MPHEDTSHNGIDEEKRNIEVKAKKPPLGLTPRNISVSLRVREILDAIERYVYAGKLIPLEWVTELKYINDKYGVGNYSEIKP